MAFEFDLSESVRDSMVKEITNAHSSGNFFYSKKFTSEGDAQAIELLLDAATAYDEHWLAFEIEYRSLMKSFDAREIPLGEYSTSHISDTASALYADGQFNRFYMIAVCNAASLQGKTVTVFAAQKTPHPKAETTKLIGKIINPEVLKTELRSMKLSLNHELLASHSVLSVKITEPRTTN